MSGFDITKTTGTRIAVKEGKESVLLCKWPTACSSHRHTCSLMPKGYKCVSWTSANYKAAATRHFHRRAESTQLNWCEYIF